MGLKNEHELRVTQEKLRVLEARLAVAREEPSENPRAHQLSLRSLERMINQMTEEIANFRELSVSR